MTSITTTPSAGRPPTPTPPTPTPQTPTPQTLTPSAATPFVRALACATLLASPALSHAGEVEPVTTCGQTVADGALIADLDCSAWSGSPAVTVTRSLDLAGFTLTGNATEESGVVFCPKRCTVVGAGTITGGHTGIDAAGQRLTVVEVSVTANASHGVVAKALRARGLVASGQTGGHGALVTRKADVTGGGFSNNAMAGLHSDRKAVVRDASATDNGGDGLSASWRLRGEGLVLTGNGGRGARGGQSARLERVTITGNASHGVRGTGSARVTDGLIADNGARGLSSLRRIRLDSVEVLRNGNGGLFVSTGGGARIEAKNTTIADNGNYGMLADEIELRSTTVTGNCPVPGAISCCADIVASRRPVLIDTDCGTTLVLPGCVENWGLCAAD